MNGNESMAKDARTWAMLSHLSVFAGFIIPFGNIIIPLVIWLSKKEESEFVADQAKEALNFQISLFVYFISGAALILYFIFSESQRLAVNIIIIAVILGSIWFYDLIITIIAAIKANEGVRFRYPLNMRFIR